VDGRGEVAQLLVDLAEPVALLRRLEQRLRVGAVDDGYRAASCSSNAEKSSSLIASSISRR
jgi:hypothetical protein